MASAPASAAPWQPGPERYGVGEHQNVPVTMSDGTVLRADVYFPTDKTSGAAAAGSFPVILTQTPYGKSSGSAASFPGGEQLAGLSGTNPYLVKRGYIDVIADVRGTGASEGSWSLFDPAQGRDGAQLVRWAAKRPHSSGKVGTLGASYLGINQLFTAANLKPGSPLKAMFPIIAANDVYRDTAFDGGLLDTEFGGIFLGLTAGLNLANPILESFIQNPSDPSVLNVLAQHIGGLLAFHASLLANVETDGNQAYDESFWRSRRPQSILGQIVRNRIPAFLVGGWFDLFQRGEPLNYSDLQNLAAGRGVGLPMKPGQQASGRYQLMMGPWYHVTAGEGIDMNRLELAWFDRWLKDKPTGIDQTKTPLHLYQLGTGKWLDASRYPIEGATPKAYYVRPGKALAPSAPPASGGSDQVVWTGLSSPCGLSTEQWGAGLLQLVLEQAGGSDPCAGEDSTTQAGPGAVTYTTAPFAKPQVLAGPIDATLYATSNRPDAEFVVNVEDVAPNGSSRPLTSGAFLGSFRQLDQARTWWAGNGKPLLPYHPYTRASKQAVPTGKVTRYDIEVRPTFAQLAAGHRLRVTISTSDVPHIVPSPSQIENLAGGVYGIQHNSAAASFLELPLGRASAFTKTCGICR
ncbi:MAG: CocE/NonD family hydrolase [Solirubrobacterales bacterium]